MPATGPHDNESAVAMSGLDLGITPWTSGAARSAVTCKPLLNETARSAR
jgi:hypothetical protein